MLKKKDFLVAHTAQERIDIESMGNYWEDFRNGEIWIYDEQFWYVSNLEMSPEEFRLYMEITHISE